jgi:23S rRNA pseudouridine1911/1915/1917 synthase
VKQLSFEYSDNESVRLDKFLDSKCPDLSRSFIQKLIKDKCVKIHGKEMSKASHKLSDGDVVELTVPDPKSVDIHPVDLNLDIIYEDKNFIIVNKVSGLVVHPGAGVGEEVTLVHGVMHAVKDLSGIGGELRPGIVHRLDKDTSGLIMICKNDTAHKFYAEKFKNREMKKTYVALTFGEPTASEGTIESEIGRHPKNRIKMASGGLQPKAAKTSYKVIEGFNHFSFIEIDLHTGRTHQIRVHFSENRLPILGDPIYGDTNVSNNIWSIISSQKKPYLKIKNLECRLMLHSHRLSFIDQNGEERTFEAPIPDEFERILSVLRTGKG